MRGGRIILILSLLLVLACSGCSRRARVIPEDTMTRIYADMFMRDQWIAGNVSSRRSADTTLVYDDIFAKYGYNYASYEKSVRYYITKPDKYEKLLTATAKRLERYAKRLERIDKAWKERFVPEGIEKRDFYAMLPLLIDSLFIPAPEVDSLCCCCDSCCCHRDSLCCCCDSCCCHRDSLCCCCDSLCCRCRRDSLCRCDSLCCRCRRDSRCRCDSCRFRADSLCCRFRADSLAIAEPMVIGALCAGCIDADSVAVADSASVAEDAPAVQEEETITPVQTPAINRNTIRPNNNGKKRASEKVLLPDGSDDPQD